MKKHLYVKVFFCLIFPFAIFSKNLSNCIICNKNPIIDQLVYKLRNPDIDRASFRTNLRKMGEYMGLEVAKHLNTTSKTITTILGENATHFFVDEDIVLITIFRAGLPLYEGLQDIFPQAMSGFFGMKRLENPNNNFQKAPDYLPIELDYYSLPNLKNKCIIIADTMIATSSSIIKAIKIIESFEPKKIIVVGSIAAQDGLKKINEHNPKIKIFVGSVDPILNNLGYIVPGLGDAGDRAYGMPSIKIHKTK